jgi:hypothetical protein
MGVVAVLTGTHKPAAGPAKYLGIMPNDRRRADGKCGDRRHAAPGEPLGES